MTVEKFHSVIEFHKKVVSYPQIMTENCNVVLYCRLTSATHTSRCCI